MPYLKQLKDKDLDDIAHRVLISPEYKNEFNTPYHQKLCRRMLIDAMRLALAEARDDLYAR